MLFLHSGLQGAPQSSVWPVGGPDDTVAVGAARLAGVYAAGDAYEDNLEITDIRHGVTRIEAAAISALVPWMGFSGGPDGISGIAVSDSGRQVFILVHDDTNPGDGLGSDAVLLYDTLATSGAPLSLFARLELFDRGDFFPFLAAQHFRGKLYVGTAYHGIHVFRAGMTDTTGTLLETAALPSGLAVRGLAIDPDANLLYAADSGNIYRASLDSSPLSFTSIGQISDIRAVAFSTHYGGPANPGLFVLSVGSSSVIHRVPLDQARGTAPFDPEIYFSAAEPYFDLAATACGRLFVGRSEDALMISDDTDARLGFDDWLNDEFDQVVAFARGLIAPDGEPAGWVIDADVQQGWSRFHPASPDGACWTVLALLLADEIRNDTQGQAEVRTILKRYASQSGDGIVPERSADGIFRHWYDPATGGIKGSWDPEFATLSTMKMVLAAVRASHYYPDDAEIAAAADAIVQGVANWASFFDPGSGSLYFKALGTGGPDLGSAGAPFHEGILFAEQSAAMEDGAVPIYERWLRRSEWPVAEWITGKPVTGNAPGQFQAAFVSLYSWLIQRDFRGSEEWDESVRNLLYTHAAWNDANGPRFFTVFSAGTTDPTWVSSGYHADSLSDHPGDVATFPSLLAFCAKGDSARAVSAYHAYRLGARQTFAGGESILYRRSNLNPSWQPNTAGLPDVVLGALGLAELIQPGVLDRILALDMAGYGLDLRRQGSILQLSWPLMGGWLVQKSTDLNIWTGLPGIPNPYDFVPDGYRGFFRLTR